MTARDGEPAPAMLDISIRVAPGTPEWPGDTPFDCGWTARLDVGSTVNLSTMTLSPHVGTHADAPLHVRDGWPASDALPIAAFVGPAAVVDVSALRGEIACEALAAVARAQGIQLDATTRLLLHTSQSIAEGRFPDAWPWLAPGCVQQLCAAGLILLGVDAPSVDGRESKNLATHHALFGAGAWNLENLDLRVIAPGRYELLSLPLSLAGLDAAPARAALRALS